jgi:sirohydrochlorin ferrochelatase
MDLTQQLVALPFKAVRQAFQETDFSKRPVGEVITEALYVGEDLAKLPLKATAAILSEIGQRKPDLEERVASLERHLGLTPTEPPATES